MMGSQAQQALLVAEVARFLEAGQLLVGGRAAPEPLALSQAEREAEQLRIRASDAGVVGLAQHFARCREYLKAAPLDAIRLRDSFRAISEITWQIKQELKSPAQSPRAPAGAAREAAELAPPRLVTGGWEKEGTAPPGEPVVPVLVPARDLGARLDQSLIAPPLLSVSGASLPASGVPPMAEPPLPASPPRAEPPLPRSLPRVHGRPPEPIISGGASPQPLMSARLYSSPPPREPVAAAEPPHPILLGRSDGAARRPAEKRPRSLDDADGSPGLLATFFGLRAFGKSTREAHGKAAQKPARAQPEPAGAGNVFGFRKGAPLAPPPLLPGHGGLPPLAPLAASLPGLRDQPAVGEDLEARLRQIRPKSGRAPRSSGRSGSQPAGRSSKGSRRPAPAGSARRDPIPWSAVLLATVFLCSLVVAAFLISERRSRATARARAQAAAIAVAATSPSPAPSAAGATPPALAAAPEAQQFQDLIAQVHGFGGEESPELAALLNAEASATYQTLSLPCQGADANCESQRLARDLLNPHKIVRRDPGSAQNPPPRWLAGLKIPAIGAKDNPDVQRWLEYYSSHSVGRELFQTMLFRCGAHQDLINKTLVHYGLPQELLAVVLTESACTPNAESAVGARGLWQFMAPTARAYHLYVQEGVIDERVSPVKSTEAAVRYLADLYRKLGNWEMVFASYNAGSGPFRMLAKLRQAGETATFWDLADAELIPEETAKYVPRIQAYALILANLRHFDFSTAQMRTAEETGDLDVPSGVRLGQVARAAGTSVAYLRALNPDLIGTVIPSLPNNRFVLQVPKAAAFRARETLEQFLHEQLDLCVSSAFDWGREQFTAEMQAKCAARRGK